MALAQTPQSSSSLSTTNGYTVLGAPVNGMVPVSRSQVPSTSSIQDYYSPSAGLNAPRGGLSNPSGVNAQPANGLTKPSALTNGLPGANQPLNAQQMGQKVGTIVSNFMQENPALLDKLNSIDMDDLAQDIGPKVEGVRAKVQQALKRMPQGIDKRLIRLFDPQSQKLATEFDEWLRKEPDPAMLAELARQEKLEAQQEASEQAGPKPASKTNRLADPYADDLLENEDPFADTTLETEPKGKPTMKDRLGDLTNNVKSKLPFNRNKPSKASLDDLGIEAKTQARSSKRNQPAAEKAELSDADLDALLNGLSFSSAGKRPNPAQPTKP